MPNTFITPNGVGKETLMRLSEKLILAGLVYRAYDPKFVGKVGDTARIKKPITFTAQDFTSTVSVQTITQTYVDVVLNKHKDVTFALTSKELSLNIDEFAKELIDPAVTAIALSVEDALAGLYVDIPYFGTLDPTSEATKRLSLLGARKSLNAHGVPDADRRFVLGPNADASILAMENFSHADKKGDTQALKDASLGHVYGFDFYDSTRIKSSTTGMGSDFIGAMASTAAAAAVSLSVNALASSGTIKAGTLLMFADDLTRQYVVTADATIASNAATVLIYPALGQQEVGTTVVNFWGGTSDAAVEESLAFHQNAFCLASAALAKPAGAAYCEVVTFNGLSCRVIADYNSSTKVDQVSVDFLFGVKTLCPEMAYRLRTY